jgi:hypothetical protein
MRPAKAPSTWIWGRDPMDMLPISSDWILGVLINLVVLILVWGTVIAGLILIVRDKVEDEEISTDLGREHRITH